MIKMSQSKSSWNKLQIVYVQLPLYSFDLCGQHLLSSSV